MPIPIIPILAALAVGAAGAYAIELIAGSAEEHERQRKKAAKLKRKAVKRAAKEERAKLQADAEHKEWALARDGIREMIEVAKAERRSLYDDLSLLREERQKIGVRLKDAKKIEDRFGKRRIREALYEYDEVLDKKYADAYRWKAVIDQLYILKDDLYGPSPNPAARIKAARRVDVESTFEATDVPIRGHVVTGIVHAPKRGPWFQLDSSIRGHLIRREQDRPSQTWSKGERVRLFVEGADYRNGTAVVSVAKAQFLDAWKAGKTTWTGKIIGENAGGVRVDVGGTVVFVPRSKTPATWTELPQGPVTVELIEVDRRLRTVVGSVIA